MYNKYLNLPVLWLVSLTILISSCTDSKKAARDNWIDPMKETPEQRDARMGWWRDARFGLFIHWGVYSVPAGTYKGEKIPGIGEWILHNAKIPLAEYREYAREFNPVKYNPKAWVKMAKDAGMKYIVITSKHHDGFALFDSKVSEWDIADATPYGKDLLKPLVRAAKKEGLKIGFYYSQAQDWTHPGGAKAGYKEGDYWDPEQAGSFDKYLEDIAYKQVEEILTNYDIDILWWDTPSWMNPERAGKLYPLLALKPGLITNNRLGGGYQGDSETPEQHIPATGFKDRDWEVCMTMNDTWGYKSYDENWKSTGDLVHKLVDIASKGGNFLLNVGPKPDGTIPQASIDRLAGVGQWMKVNSESIYGTSASPFRRPWWGRCTRKSLDNGDNRLYLHVFEWPEDQKLTVPVNNDAAGCWLLADKSRNFEVEKGDRRVIVRLTGDAPDQMASVVVLDIKGDPDVPNQNLTPGADGSIVLIPEEGDLENRGYVEADHARLIRTPAVSYINWKTNRTWMEWPVEIPTSREYDIMVSLASTTPEDSLSFKAGETTSVFSLPDTKSPDVLTEVKIGSMLLPEGTFNLTVRPADRNWQGKNIGAIRLAVKTK